MEGAVKIWRGGEEEIEIEWGEKEGHEIITFLCTISAQKIYQFLIMH